MAGAESRLGQPRPLGQVNLAPDYRTGGGISGVSRRGEPGSQGRPISLTQELSNWNRDNLGSNPPLRLWAAMDDISGLIDTYGDKASKETAWKVKWSFYIIAHPSMEKIQKREAAERPARMSPAPQMFAQLKEEQRKRGEDVPYIELNHQQVDTLKWALDMVGIPLEADENGMVISLEPFAHAAAGVQFARRIYTKQSDKEARELLAQSYTTQTGRLLQVIEGGKDASSQPQEEELSESSNTEPRPNNITDMSVWKKTHEAEH